MLLVGRRIASRYRWRRMQRVEAWETVPRKLERFIITRGPMALRYNGGKTARADEACPFQTGSGQSNGVRPAQNANTLSQRTHHTNHPVSNAWYMPRGTILSHYSKSVINFRQVEQEKVALYRDCASYQINGFGILIRTPPPPKCPICPLQKRTHLQPRAYSSSSASSSTLGAAYLCRASSPPVAICVSVAVVVALAGSGWPVVAAKVDCALALPILPDERLFFFFLAVCTL